MFLCHLVEDGIVKCEHYWPDAPRTTRLYGDISVTLVRTTSFANYDVRRFRVCAANSYDDDAAEHVVTQYQFTAWPDHGVPRHPLALLDFHAKVSAGKMNLYRDVSPPGSFATVAVRRFHVSPSRRLAH